MDWIEITLRLSAATLIGGVLGLNRDLHGKPTGVRTLGLVGLGSAMVVVAVVNTGSGTGDFSAASRIVQGILTGIGFLGAGVIVHDARSTQRVHGLTTAACTWLTACLGTVCGFAQAPVIVIAGLLTAAVLIFGGPIERWFHARLPRSDDNPGAP
jgi:putative Mg2+ transporter-C (MgtC) family protein